MESKECMTYSRRAKSGERPQQSLFESNKFHGYRSTKQWVEEASQQCRQGAIYRAEQQQKNDGATRALNSTPTRAATRKKDGRGVRFKQENDQSASRLESKVGNQVSSRSPAIPRKDCFSDGQAVALSPISLNVAAGGRQVANISLSAKHSPVVAALPQGVPQTQGHLICADGRVQTMPSGRDDDGREVVWCNAAFEADDDLRSYKSQDSASARSNRFSPASCSNIVECEVSDSMRASPLNHKQDQQECTSSFSNANTNLSIIFSPENVSCSPAISSASAVAGSSPATRMTKSPVENSTLPHTQLKLEAAAGEWYTPVGSESTSQSSRRCARSNDNVMDLSKTRRTLAAMPSFNATAPPTSLNPNRSGPGARASSSSPDEAPSSTSNTHGKSPKYFNEVPPSGESAGRRNPKQMLLPRTSTPARSCISDGNGPKGAKRAGSIPVPVGKVNLHALNLPTNSTPKQQRFQHDTMVEADLEADIEHEIEEEISSEILLLSQRLAALQAKQETRREGGAHEQSKAGGMSCPQTPLRSAPSPCGSDSTTKRRGRVVAAKFLQYKNEGPNVRQGPGRSAAKLMEFNEGPFIGRPNPPRRSLGTPSRLLTRDKASGQQRPRSPNHMGRPPDSEAQSRGSAGTKVTIEEYVRDRAVLESGSKRLAALSLRNLGEEDRKECNRWNDRGIGQSKKEHHHPAPSLSIGSGAVQSHYYPEFERKVDWVKTLRNGPLPPAHHCGTVNSAGQTLDDTFLTQTSERQDIRAWLRENMGEAEGNGEIPSFTPISGKGCTMPEEIQEDVKKLRSMDLENANGGLTPARSARPNNVVNTPSSYVRATTPNRLTPNGKTTPSRGNSRTVPSRYGTPIKATSAKTPTTGSRFFDSKLTLESQGARRCCSQTSPRKRCSKDCKGGFFMRKVSPTSRKGYPGVSGVSEVRNGCIALGASRKSKGSGSGVGTSKHERGILNNNDEVPKVERKIIVVEAEYEKFVQGVRIVNQIPEVYDTPVVGGRRGQEGAEQGVVTKLPSLMGDGDACEPPSSIKPPKKIFIRCSDLIKDKHSSLIKGKQRRLTGQSVLPSECQDSDDSVFARSNTRTDSSELDENNSKSEVASVVEERAPTEGAGRDCQLLSQRRDAEGVPFVTGSIKRSEKSRARDYDVVYDYKSGNQGMSSYLPEDYTLEMMLQYVDNLKSEREGLPRIRATKDVVDSNSPRDSGCIKRTREGERKARYYFNGAGGGDEVQATKSSTRDNEGLLSPNEIEGLDLESFWCLVGELEEPVMITRP